MVSIFGLVKAKLTRKKPPKRAINPIVRGERPISEYESKNKFIPKTENKCDITKKSRWKEKAYADIAMTNKDLNHYKISLSQTTKTVK